MNDIAHAVERLFPGRHVLTAARGATALYLALVAIRRIAGDGEVVVPATICPTVPLVIELAGLEPRFCDVELNTWCASSDTLASALTTRTRAVILVYLFGKGANFSEMADSCEKLGIHVIEDIAHAPGTVVDQRLAGSFGSCTILSFNEKKVLRGGGGAAAFARAELFREAVRAAAHLQDCTPAARIDELAQSFHNLNHGTSALLRATGIDRCLTWAHEWADSFADVYVRATRPQQLDRAAMISSLETLAVQRQARHARASAYIEELSDLVEIVPFGPDEMCWRLPLRVGSHVVQREIVNALRRDGWLVSDHYFPASCLFGVPAPPNARTIGLCGVNLCVDGGVPTEDIPRMCSSIRRVVESADIEECVAHAASTSVV